MRADRSARMAEYQQMFDDAMQEPLDMPPLPWSARQVIHDGPGWQFFDANGKPILCDLLRDSDDAAWLLRFIRHIEQQRKEATQETVREHSEEYRAMRELVLAARRLDGTLGEGNQGNPLYADVRKALEFFTNYWSS